MSDSDARSSLRRAVVLRALRAYARLAPTERGAYGLVKAARRCVPPDAWRGVFPVRGLRLSLDLGTYPDCCMAAGLYELDTMRLLRRLLRPGDGFVDAGANIGYFTLLASRCVGPSGRVDAYEPDPFNYQRLQQHVQDNGAANVRAHALALSDEAQSLQFVHVEDSARGNHGMSGSFLPPDAPGQRFTVQAVRLDQHLQGAPRLIKIDIEGGEYRALGGMSGILASTHPPALIIEHNHVSAVAAGYTPAQLFARLVEVQPAYRAYWIGLRLWPIPTADSLQRISRQGNVLFMAS